MKSTTNAYVLEDRWAQPKPHTLRTIDGRGHKEAIKGSNKFRAGLLGDPKKLVFVYCGHEDGIDVVRGAQYTFANLVLHSDKSSRGRSYVTIKGGIKGVALSSIMLSGRTRWWRDIGIGDFTDYGWKAGPTTGVHIYNVFHQTGRKVRILVFNGDKPVVDRPENYRIIKIPKVLCWVYFKILEGRGYVLNLFGKKPS